MRRASDSRKRRAGERFASTRHVNPLATFLLLQLGACADTHEVPLADGGADSGAPDAGLFVAPGNLWAQAACEDDGTVRFLAEIYLEPVPADCTPSASVDALLLIGIDRWDGRPGTFPLGAETPRGRAQIGLAPPGPPETPTGTLVVEAFELGHPRFMSWDSDLGSGRIDLGLCGRFDMLPCR